MGGWVGGFFQEIYPLCGSILQAGTCQIFSFAENPRWSRGWQQSISSVILQTIFKTIMCCTKAANIDRMAVIAWLYMAMNRTDICVYSKEEQNKLRLKLCQAQIQLRLRLRLGQIEIRYFYSQGRSFHYLYGWLGGWVVGILESNAKLNSKLRLKLKLKIELSLAIQMENFCIVNFYASQIYFSK